jgi:hypothetical protein
MSDPAHNYKKMYTIYESYDEPKFVDTITIKSPRVINEVVKLVRGRCQNLHSIHVHTPSLSITECGPLFDIAKESTRDVIIRGLFLQNLDDCPHFLDMILPKIYSLKITKVVCNKVLDRCNVADLSVCSSVFDTRIFAKCSSLGLLLLDNLKDIEHVLQVVTTCPTLETVRVQLGEMTGVSYEELLRFVQSYRGPRFHLNIIKSELEPNDLQFLFDVGKCLQSTLGSMELTTEYDHMHGFPLPSGNWRTFHNVPIKLHHARIMFPIGMEITNDYDRALYVRFLFCLAKRPQSQSSVRVLPIELIRYLFKFLCEARLVDIH